MRRVLLLLGVLAAVVLFAWWALRDVALTDDPTGSAAAVSVADDAASPDEPGRPRKPRGRTKAGEKEAADESGVPSWMREWPEVGQDVPQDPSLGAISGRLFVSQGVPADEAVVEATLRGQLVARMRLRGQSQFLLKNVAPAAGVALAARSEGYAPGGLDKIAVKAGQTTDVGAVYLGMAMDADVDNRVEVEVYGDGKPLAGAQVTATTVYYGSLLSLGSLEKQPGGTILRATTDETGRATFERFPPASYDVFAEAEGWTFEVRPRQLFQKTTKSTVRFDMKPGLTIEGRAQTEDGKPVADARVVVLRWSSFTNVPPATTDAEGKFVITGLSGGNYFVVVAKADVGSKDLQNVAAGTKDLVVTLPLGADIWIKCTDAATGTPVLNYGVRPFRKVPFAYMLAPLIEAKTTDGVYRMKLLAASDYGAEISAPGYTMANVATLPLSPAAPFEVKLEPAGMIRGRVVAKGTTTPIRGAQVFLKRGGLPPSRVKDQQTVTDAKGVFTLDHLPRTAVSIWISHVDHDEATFEGVEPVVRAAGAPLPEPRTFELGSGGRIEGRVLSVAGGPEAGQNLSLLVGFDFMNGRNAVTDAQGRYAFTNVPVGPKYTISLGQFNPGRPGRAKSDVTVSEGSVTVVDFIPEGGGQRVAGRVLRDQKPAADVNVTLLSDDGGQFTGQDRSKPDGTFAFENVPAGKYVIRAAGGGSRTASLSVKADEAPAEVVLALATAGIAGKVVDASTGAAVTGAWVECDQVGDSGGAALTDLVRTNRGRNPAGADGTFAFRGLEDGVYMVRAVRDGYGTELLDGIVIKDGASRDGVTVALGPACTVTGSVRNALGVPVEGAALQLRDAKGRRVFSIALTQSNGDGTYAQGTLRPETYDITFEKDGYAPATQRVTLAADAPTKLDFTLLQGGRIEVVVKGSDGAPMKDAVVTLLDTNGRPVTRGVTLQTVFSLNRNRTDANGVVVLAGVAAGSYRVSVVPQGRDDATLRGDVEVSEGGLTPVEIVVAASAAASPGN